MKKEIIILGSTGSIGKSIVKILRKNKKKFSIKILTTNNNISTLYKQAIEFKVNIVVINNKEKFEKFKNKFKYKNINVFFDINDAVKSLKKKVYYSINGISGINGLLPTINVIPYTKNLAIANKESIICGWKFIKKELKKNNTNFIPIDSEHFSIWRLLKNENIKNVNKIYLTASGGPFLKKKLSQIKNIKSKYALKHPNWKMGKKISIDSATMMNKIFEIIEAVKIFELNIDKFGIIIHPSSYIHSVIQFKTGISKMLTHETSMEVPILNSLYLNNDEFLYRKEKFNFSILNGINFINPDVNKFICLKILKNIKLKNTYFEIILVSLNDYLVKMYLNDQISFIFLQKKLINLIKHPYFKKYYRLYPNNIKDIENMVEKVNIFLDKMYLKQN
tara:strand:+ start:3614 stop:4789 length:1176 start_codon:yes stop_codon:yes gene_type:complete